MSKSSKKEAKKSEESKIHHQIFATASNAPVLRKAWIAAIEAGAAAAIAVIKQASDLEIAEAAKPEDVPAEKSKKKPKASATISEPTADKAEA